MSGEKNSENEAGLFPPFLGVGVMHLGGERESGAHQKARDPWQNVKPQESLRTPRGEGLAPRVARHLPVPPTVIRSLRKGVPRLLCMGEGPEGPCPPYPTSSALPVPPSPYTSPSRPGSKADRWALVRGHPGRMGTAPLSHQECYQPHSVPTGGTGHSGHSPALALRWAGVLAWGPGSRKTG